VRVLRSTISRIAEPQHPLLARRPEEKVLALVLTGERGLAGAFNTNILRKANEFFRANKNSKLSVIPVGKKGRDALRKAGFNLIAEYTNVLARVEFASVREISNLVTDLYAKGEIDSVYIIFSEFKTVMSATLTVEKLLPVDAAQVQEGSEGAAGSAQVDYIYEQPEEQLLDRLLPRYVESQVQRAMLESSAAEHAARMTAMESATKNAGDVIEALTLHMNKVRQAAITKEIIEIVSGASNTA
jgi:F-type H+-transporting ATPase subunit gamma